MLAAIRTDADDILRTTYDLPEALGYDCKSYNAEIAKAFLIKVIDVFLGNSNEADLASASFALLSGYSHLGLMERRMKYLRSTDEIYERNELNTLSEKQIVQKAKNLRPREEKCYAMLSEKLQLRLGIRGRICLSTAIFSG